MKTKTTLIVTAALVVVALIGYGGYRLAHWNYDNPRTMVCTVTDKDRTKKDGGGSDMRVYTEQCSTLTVTDLLFAGSFDSSDTFQKIEVGNTYRFKVSGHRAGWLSSFPVIREVNLIEAGR